jgi:thiol:disulfide interchange protein DsbC
MKSLARLMMILAWSMALAPTATRAQDSANLRKSLESAMGPAIKIESIRDAGFLGLMEITAGADVFYTDKKGSHLIVGDIIDARTRKNITEDRRASLATKIISAAQGLAIKTVRGNGQRVLYTFEDPDCGYCRKLAAQLQKINNLTVYTFLLPMLSNASAEKSRAILCAQDPSAAWNDLMLKNVAPSKTDKSCNPPLDKLMVLGDQLRVRGTPALFFPNGTRVPGYIAAEQIEKQL